MNPLANRIVKGALALAAALLILLGTLVITTFDPCPTNATKGTVDTSLCSELGR